LLIEATPNTDNEEARQDYLSKAPVIVKKHGGLPIATYEINTVLDSETKPGAVVVMSFPNQDSIHNLFEDPSYQDLITIRDKAFSNIRFFICNEKI